jgi:hypothetical protein
LELPESPVICTDAQMLHSTPVIPSIRSVSAYVQQRPSRRPAPARIRKQSRQAPPAQSQPLRRWLVSAQVLTRTSTRVLTRTLQRTRKPASSPLPKDDPASVLLLLMFLLLLPLLMCLVCSGSFSCHESPGGASLSPPTSRSKCLTSSSVASRPCVGGQLMHIAIGATHRQRCVGCSTGDSVSPVFLQPPARMSEMVGQVANLPAL